MKRKRILRLLACLLATACSAAALPIYAVQAVGPAGLDAYAYAINESGTIAGAYQQSDGSWRGFLDTNGQTTVLQSGSDATQSWATAVNNAGTVVGYTDGQALAWSNLQVDNLGPGYAMAINNNGDIGGMMVGPDGSGRAYITRDGALLDLGMLSGDFSAVYGLNDNGAASGTALTNGGQMRAFLAAPGQQPQWLGGIGGGNSYATTVNNSGTVAGHAQNASGAMNAVRWVDGVATNLGTLGGLNSYSYRINNRGDVVGYSDLPGDGGTAAFLYQNGALMNLNALISPEAGWVLLSAYGMNDRGEIVGRGLLNGVVQAFVLRPPDQAESLDGLNPPPELQESPNEPTASPVPEPPAFLLGLPALATFILLYQRRSQAG